jgi:hypothetical protein
VFYALGTVVLVIGHARGLIPEEGTPWLNVLDYASAFGLLAAIVSRC